ncbi:hypothetical protein K2X40_02575 [Candidatus Babeliales bacterium]|nr:hypothetical protein [Candidatus Babeliales bacterium]
MIIEHVQSILHAQRIAILGCSGTGKTTLARNLGTLLNLPVHHLDRYYWQPGWQASDHQMFKNVHQKLCIEPRWIIDGNQTLTQPERCKHADVIIFLDFSRHIYWWRVVTRWFAFRNKQRPDLAPGCRDSLNRHFITYILNFKTTWRPIVLRNLEEQKRAGKTIIVLHSPHEASVLLKKLQEQSSVSIPAKSS